MIQRNGITDAYPLTRLQWGMLFHSAYDSSPIYHDVLSLEVRGSFNKLCLERTLDELSYRHPVLRTSFDIDTHSVPMQLVHRTARVPFRIEDLVSLSPGVQGTRLQNWIEQEKKTKFDYS